MSSSTSFILVIGILCASIFSEAVSFILEGTSTSYAQFRKWNAGLNGTLEFEFKTDQGSGLLLYTDDGGTYDFFEIKLVESALRLRYNLGGGAQIVTVGRDLGDGHWHKVQVTRNNENTTLTVDGISLTSMSRGKEFEFGKLIGNSDVYIGGMPSWYNSKLTLLALPSVIFEPRFSGIIRNLVYADGDTISSRRQEMKSRDSKVLTAVQFYAQGCYQRSVGNQFQHNMSQASVSRIIHAVTNAINVRLLRRWIKFPMTQQERAAARAKFRDAPQPFEGAIGAIDCSFINIVGPVEHEEAYVNHHGNHALNVQAIVDPDLKILNINARYPGARNDSYIWSNSPIKRAMEFHYNRGERRTWLIGDAGYALEPWLMTPLPHYPEGTQQFEYTQQLCKARNPVERFFGCLKSTWRCCSFQRILMYEPGLAGRIINACAVLHNMRMDHRLPADDFYNADDAGPHQALGLDAQIGGEGVQANNRVAARAVAHRIQKQIMRERFPDFLDGDIQNDINE